MEKEVKNPLREKNDVAKNMFSFTQTSETGIGVAF